MYCMVECGSLLCLWGISLNAVLVGDEGNSHLQPILCCTIMKNRVLWKKLSQAKRHEPSLLFTSSTISTYPPPCPPPSPNMICDWICEATYLPGWRAHRTPTSTLDKGRKAIDDAFSRYTSVQNLAKCEGRRLFLMVVRGKDVCFLDSNFEAKSVRRLHVLLRFCSLLSGLGGFKLGDRADLAPRALKQPWSITPRKPNQEKITLEL